MNDFARLGPYLRMLQDAPLETAVAIRPAHPNDVQAILDMHDRLSTDSLFLRYLVPYVPSRLAAHIHDICTRPAAQGQALVATSGTQVVGFGFYVVRPKQPDTAEPALLVEDRFQARGIGGRLFNRLITAARGQGVRYFDALAHASNRQMLRLLRRSGRQVSSAVDSGCVAVLLSLPAA